MVSLYSYTRIMSSTAGDGYVLPRQYSCGMSSHHRNCLVCVDLSGVAVPVIVTSMQTQRAVIKNLWLTFWNTLLPLMVWLCPVRCIIFLIIIVTITVVVIAASAASTVQLKCERCSVSLVEGMCTKRTRVQCVSGSWWFLCFLLADLIVCSLPTPCRLQAVWF